MPLMLSSSGCSVACRVPKTMSDLRVSGARLLARRPIPGISSMACRRPEHTLHSAAADARIGCRDVRQQTVVFVGDARSHPPRRVHFSAPAEICFCSSHTLAADVAKCQHRFPSSDAGPPSPAPPCLRSSSGIRSAEASLRQVRSSWYRRVLQYRQRHGIDSLPARPSSTRPPAPAPVGPAACPSLPASCVHQRSVFSASRSFIIRMRLKWSQ